MLTEKGKKLCMETVDHIFGRYTERFKKNMQTVSVYTDNFKVRKIPEKGGNKT